MHLYLEKILTATETFADSVAICDRNGTRRTDYRTFGTLVRKTAAWLLEKGLSERAFIPIRLPASMEYAAVEVGVLLAGHIAVPMGDTFPQERVRYISLHCDAPFIIDETALEEILACEPVDPALCPESTDDDTAILLYTSGSTGAPKGILHSFAGLKFTLPKAFTGSYGPSAVWAMGAPFYFVAGMSVFKVLMGGGTVHLISHETNRDVRLLEDYIERHGITVAFISPAVLRNFHNRSTTLGLVFTGSERLTGQYGKDGYKLWNNYGMSETLGTLCAYLVEQPFETTPVGIPKEHIEWCILGEDGNPVPKGEEGEMCVRGVFTKGYFKDPDATAKLYRDGWLHTGDILKELPDGNLVYINRKDWMLKINGQRVEPGEIEMAMREVDGVDTAVVKGVRSPDGQTLLCAWFTGTQTEEVIRAALEKRLAAYMVPSVYVHLDTLPLNSNGKEDRKSLPDPDFAEQRADYAAPENETEALLCRAFEESLGVRPIGIDDDFFRLGGDSIRVMKLATACPELDLTTKQIYAARTPRAIAALLIGSGKAKLREKKDRYPLSDAQIGIYVASMQHDGEAVYNNPILLKLDPTIEPGRLCRAVEAAVTAHPFIKMRITVDTEGNPWQNRNDEEPYTQAVEQMTEAQFAALQPKLMQPFRLLKDRLFRIRVIRTERTTYLFMDFHHIIFDGSSMLVLLNDLERAYNGETPETERYGGFEVAEDEAEKRAKSYDESKDWYLNIFGALDLDSLPIRDRYEPTPSFGTVERALALEAVEAEAFCREAGVTENIYATAAFGLCAGLFSGAKEALFATIYNGRDSLRTARTVAMLVRTLPVWSSFDAQMPIVTYLENAKAQMLGCMAHDAYPFADLAAETGVTSDLLFVYQGDVLNVGGFSGTPIERIPLMDNATGEKITIQMYKQGGVYNIRAEYRSDLYSEEMIRTILESYENVLVRMLRCETVGEISPASEAQRKLLASWNDRTFDYDTGATVVSMFNRAAEQFGSSVAVIDEDGEMTYSELDRRTDALAAHLQQFGLGRGDVVSVLIPRGRYQAITFLGALKAGCAYQPLDGTYPAERLNFMVRDAAAKLLITTEELGEHITEYDGRRLTIREIEALPDGTPKAVCKPEDLFILLYTSGSTGVPKGVRLTHANLVSFIEWYRRFYALTPLDRVGQYASYGFDACMMDMYPALCSGAAVCIVPEEMRYDLETMNRFFAERRVSLAFLTTQVGRQFAAEMENPYLRALSVGGEKLASMEPPKTYAFYNAYGPTECTIFSTIYPVTRSEENIPIGRPLENVKCYVVDAFGHQLPAGAIGELLIAGPNVGDGYLNRPEKTAEVFIDNPFDGGIWARAYRTGDIVRYRSDGEIEFIGRRDGQVKIHGFRIELTEIEAVIREFPSVRDVTVNAIDLGADGKSIAAYVVGDAPIDTEALKQYIGERKPPYMIPAAFVQLDKIPLTPNGKVNRRALPKPELPAVGAEDDTHEDNALEAALREIVGQAINAPHPPLGTQLAWLGLTSLGTIRLSAWLFKRFDVKFDAKELGTITIREIEDRILDQWMNGSSAQNAQTEEITEAELSAAQQGIYVDCMKEPDSTAYNIPSVLTFDPSTDPDALAAAVRSVIDAHRSVDVHFEIRNDRVTSVRNTEPYKIPVREMTEEECEALRKTFVMPFRLGQGPLFRFTVVRTPAAVRLFSDFHHLVFDGFSFNIFLKDLGEALNGAAVERESASYAFFAREQKALLEGTQAEETKAYLNDLFADYESATELTGDIPGKGMGSKKAYAVHPLREKDLQSACTRCRVTEAGFLLAALDYTLARLTASDHVYIATISSGRSDIRFSDTFGMFVNTLPLAAKLDDGTVDEFIKTVSDGLEQAIAHENHPFAQVAADWGFTPQVMYEYQRGILEKPAIPGILKAEGLEPDRAKFKMTVRIEDGKEGPQIAVEYNDALYSAGLMREFVRSYAITVEKLAAFGRRKLRSISLLDESRQAQIDAFRRVDDPTVIAPETRYQSGLERFAKQTPDHPALIACDASYTYAALDAAANRVANALIARGVRPGGKIVLLLPRTSRVIISLFGVLKSGCAYIPCDPKYPVERVRHILEDSGASLVITDRERLARFTDMPAVDAETLLEEPNETRPDVAIAPDDLAYLIYTSGSTGKPKGVMLTHRGIVNYMTDAPANILVHAYCEEGHTITGVTTLSFDMSVKEFAVTLFNGLTFVLASDNECNDANALAVRMTETNTDLFQATPSRLMTLLESKAFREALSRCRIIVCAGEKYPDSLLKRLQTAFSARIFNTYGPTEITVSCNIRELTHDASVSVGRPLLNVTEFIVDSDGNEVPVGVVGELYIGGPGVAKGYHNLPEMTAERFRTYQGIRIYCSGDFARWTEDGNVEILGRKDNQIKLRGLRIELGEVESVLSAVPGITRCAVKIDKINGIEHLCAWFTADHAVDIGALKKELGRTLTNYMVPTAYMQLDAMPITPNGKLDLKNLPAPQLYRADNGAKAASETEKAICRIFSELLHVEDVGAEENFFELGGTSLLVTNVIIAAQKQGLAVSFADVFAHPTARELAQHLGDTDTVKTVEEDDPEITGYDYTEIRKLLDENTLERFRAGTRRELGNVLVTGATGYLGIHVVHELIEKETGRIYCLLRGRRGIDAVKRLKGMLFYYFDNSYEELFGTRILPIDGDVTDAHVLDPIGPGEVQTVINCAAVVKHFSSGTLLEDVNLGGVRNLISFCKRTGAALVQTSTMSTVTSIYKDKIPDGLVVREQMLYFGQLLDNKYVRSKFLAERAVLEAAARDGLHTKIIRLGNLAARYSDGEFQANFQTNSAMGRLHAFQMLGCYSYEQADLTMEFSPIDAVAEAVVALSRTPEESRVFHAFNHQQVLFNAIFSEMGKLGMPVRAVESDVFAKAFAEAESDPKKAQELTSIMAYRNAPGSRETVMMPRHNEYTMQVLYRLGFNWPVTTWDYIDRFIRALKGLGYFS
ncbi:MAG: amino acid adenylation domain-containing protein [Clostridia bacterium]|nr:amino acid adenylation domain-containing protein [Clostridia bacterium]